MAIGKVIKCINERIFSEFDDIIDQIEFTNDRARDIVFSFFIQIPHITKADILEYFEYHIAMFSYDGAEEIYDAFVPCSFITIHNLIENNNDPKPVYTSEYINIVGQIFLAGYIEFGMCGLQDKEENLLSRQKDKYQAWIYFRDNFFYANAYDRDFADLEKLYKELTSDKYISSNWNTPQYWDKYHFWVARTKKGDKYFNEILAPRFYEKYKDLSVEIDENGNIVRWIGQINR